MRSTRITEKQPDVRKAFKLKFFNSKNVSVLFLCSTILFTLLALIIFYAQSGKFVKRFDYTDCPSPDQPISPMNSSPLDYRLRRSDSATDRPANSSGQPYRPASGHSFSNSARHSSPRVSSVHTCMLDFYLPDDSYEALYIHYQMHDYYKNFLTFSNSYSNKQIFGDFDSYVLDQCGSQTDHSELYHSVGEEACAIAPCGELPNFMFNDTLRIYYHLNATAKLPIEISSSGITDSYFDQNFNNPGTKMMQIVQKYTRKPRNWRKSLFELDPTDDSNNGFRHQRLIVWMYPNPFSDFSKLYGKVTAKFDDQISRRYGKSSSARTNDGLRAAPSGKLFSYGESPYLRKGNYSLVITYNYPLWSDKSLKRFSISTVGIFGQDNQMFKAFICLASVVSFLSTIIVYLIYRFHDNKYRLYISDLSNADVQF